MDWIFIFSALAGIGTVALCLDKFILKPMLVIKLLPSNVHLTRKKVEPVEFLVHNYGLKSAKNLFVRVESPENFIVNGFLGHDFIANRPNVADFHLPFLNSRHAVKYKFGISPEFEAKTGKHTVRISATSEDSNTSIKEFELNYEQI